jgi:CRP-like cAMP-binding protein
MTGQLAGAQQFQARLGESLRREPLAFATLKVAKHRHVYRCGDQAEMVYFIERGQIKLLLLSPEGKECLLAIHTAGDLFGELCLAGVAARQETATAMEETTLKRIPYCEFFLHLGRHSLLEGFTQYLAARLAEQQQLITSLMMVDSEHRLGETLLLLARKLGKPDPCSIRIEQKITHEELSEMVGTTRPRITEFMQRFRTLGLIEITPERFLVVREDALTDYLTRLS